MEPRFDLVHHSSDVAVGADADHLSIALPGISPVEDFDGHTAHSPRSHFTLRGFVEIDGINARKGKAVVIHLVDFTGGPNSENSPTGPARPVGGGAVHDAVSQGCSDGCLRPVSEMIALTLRVGGGADFLNCCAVEGRLIAREGMKTSPQSQWKKQEKKYRALLH